MPVTEEDVRAAYRIFLRRDPENERVVEDFCRSVAQPHELMDKMLFSDEFYRKFGKDFASLVGRLQATEPERVSRWRREHLVLLKTDHGEFEYARPKPGDFQSFYIFALHKSGSSLLTGMMSRALDAAGVPRIDIPDAAFNAGMPDKQLLNPEEIFFDKGYGYLGFRSFPRYLRGCFISANKKTLLVRDPRDMLVSYYFSMASGHKMPDGGAARESLENQRRETGEMTIDEYCLYKAKSFLDEFAGYDEILDTEVRLYRYEEVIFHKAEWLADMLSYLDIALEGKVIEQIARENDIRPETERPGEHIRQVTPGNYKRHLKPATISELTEKFREVLDRFSYD